MGFFFSFMQPRLREIFLGGQTVSLYDFFFCFFYFIYCSGVLARWLTRSPSPLFASCSGVNMPKELSPATEASESSTWQGPPLHASPPCAPSALLTDHSHANRNKQGNGEQSRLVFFFSFFQGFQQTLLRWLWVVPLGYCWHTAKRSDGRGLW